MEVALSIAHGIVQRLREGIPSLMVGASQDAVLQAAAILAVKIYDNLPEPGSHLK